ncbi:MAG TPA: hypothetical protein EYQ20_02470 [candidate division Zixibacteria bacterium]|nr:hypothetical protein [candidate division Zixibacteria bacterium]
MTPLDYGRSFLIGTAPMNEVRFWVESRIRIIDEETDVSADYYQCASCKSEDTFAERDLFLKDNYDFLPVFGLEFGLIFRRNAWHNKGYKSIVKTEDMWDGPLVHLVEGSACALLDTTDAVLEATRRYAPIVAQTEIRDTATSLRAVIEYPVKTMNTRRSGPDYQVDTGPVLFPDLSLRSERQVDGMLLAFIAFNTPHFADFVLEVPTSAVGPAAESDREVQVHHYSKRLSVKAKNRLYAVE